MENNNLSPNAFSLSSFPGQGSSGGDPGSQLQRAREERRWTRADIAAMLHLNINVITALEENDYSGLPFPTFVRGYLRSYANLLELPSEPLLAAYERRGFSSATPAPIPLRAQHPVSTDRMWYFFSYIVALGLILLVVLWWRSDPNENDQDVLMQLPTPTGNNPPYRTSPTSDDKFHENSRELADILAVGPPPEDTPASNPAPTPQPLEVPVATNPTIPSTTSANPPTPEPESAPTVTPPSPLPSDTKPSITIRATTVNAWVKITDVHKRVLFNAQITAGQNQTITGNPPFKVNLARVERINVEYNGQPFDFQKYIKKGKTARFTIGKNP